MVLIVNFTSFHQLVLDENCFSSKIINFAFDYSGTTSMNWMNEEKGEMFASVQPSSYSPDFFRMIVIVY